MNAGHTPGPWSFRELRGDDGLGYIEADGHDIMHAGVSDLPADENRANARLTASAPELLALLIRYRNETPLGNQPHMIAHKADELIARATGAA